MLFIKKQLNYQTIDIMDYQKHIGQSVVSVLSIVRVKVINDKNGQQMCFVTFNDENDQIDGVVFSQNYDKYRHILTKGAICLVEGKI